MTQDRITESVDKEVQERVTAAKLIQGHIEDLLPGILKDLDPLKDVDDREALEEQLKPWLAQQVAEEIGHMVDSRNLLEGKKIFLNIPKFGKSNPIRHF